MVEQKQKGPGVLFDVDGTLVDSTYLHALAWWRSVKDVGEDIALFRIHRLIGMGADKLVEGLFGQYRPEIDEGYTKHFRELKQEVVTFPKVPELLSQVHARGAKVVLATSAKPEDIDHLTDLIGAQDAVDEVVHSGDVEESKPSPDIFSSALEKAGSDPDRTLTVGDSVWDVEAAAKCGLKCVGLLTGGISEAELTGAGAVAVFQDPADLLDNLDESPLARILL